MFEDEMKKDVKKYTQWFNEFQNFLKEGLSMDSDNSQQLLRLMRYDSTLSDDTISLDEYVKNMKKDQQKIYFLVTPSKEIKKTSPYLETFRENNVPVLCLANHIDEICFRNVGEFKGYKLINIETSYEEISKDLGNVEVDNSNGIPEEDISSFCLWLKNELGGGVTKVSLSKRLRGSPAIITGAVSSSMRAVFSMMDQ